VSEPEKTRIRSENLEKEVRTKKMKTRMIASFMVIALVAAVIGGASMAWFTAKAEAPAAEFTAGTVMIEADAEFDVDAQFTNVNPGDCWKACWEFKNTGSKAIQLRLVGEGHWEFDWEWVWENRDALCYSGVWNTEEEMKADPMFSAGNMGDPLNPVIAVPCSYKGLTPGAHGPGTPPAGWRVVLVDVDGQPTFSYPDVAAYHMYYDADVAPGETIQLCLCVYFSGPRMTNIFQGAIFTLGGKVQAIQASNDAPSIVWGNVSDYWVVDPRLDEIDFDECKDQVVP